MADMREKPNTRTRNGGDRNRNENFAPPARYPHLNANAGRSRLRNAPRRRGKTAPQARIRLDSTVPSAAMRLQAFNGGNFWNNFWRTGRVVSFIGLCATIVLTYYLLNSPNFYVTRIEVKNSRYLNYQEAVRVAELENKNIFLLSEAEVARKIKVLPYVQDVRVTKALPDKLTLELTERQRAVIWKVGSLNYIVDAEGIVLESHLDKDLPAEVKNFPGVQSLDERRLKPGDRVDIAAVRSAATVQGELTKAGIKIAAVQYSPGSGLLVQSAPDAGNWRALFGTDAQLERKIAILRALLADKNIKWSYADLRFVNKPSVQ
jgi:POTRA domain, FtsQ-type/Cell division protein FtsQ